MDNGQFQYSSIFGALTKNVQIRFDQVSELGKTLFDSNVFESYLTWDVPSIGTDFEELVGQYAISVAAPTIGDNSKESVLGTEGVETFKSRVFNHAITQPITIQDYRRVMQILDSKSLPDKTRTQQLVDLMWGNVEKVVGSVLSKIDMLFLIGLSQGGKITFSDENNPEGGVRGTVDFKQPEDNIWKRTIEWNAATSSDDVDCFADIQKVIDAAQDRVEFAEILLSPARLSYICRSKKLRQLIWGTDKGSRLVQLADLNNYMSENSLPTFKPIRRTVRVQSAADGIKDTKPFNADALVFVPAGNLGVIKNAYANNELKPEPGVTYSNYGRVRVSQWGVGDTQGAQGVEFTKAECFALPVITEMNGIYTLEVGNTTPLTTKVTNV